MPKSEKESVFTTAVVKEGRVTAENEYAFAFPTNIPITPGHMLVAPKRVVATIDELDDKELIALIDLLRRVKRALRSVLGAKGFNIAWNEGKDYGQSVPRLHIHIVPRSPGDAGITKYEPREFLYRPGSREETPLAELNAIADQLRAVL